MSKHSHRTVGKYILTSSVFIAAGALPVGAVVIPLTADQPYQQDFNSLTTTAEAALPTDWKVDTFNSGKQSLYQFPHSFADAATTTSYTHSPPQGPGSSAAVGIYNFIATKDHDDHAVGFIGSNKLTSGNIYMKLSAPANADIDTLWVAYHTEQYRRGIAGAHIQMFYSTTGEEGSWTKAGIFYQDYPGGGSPTGISPVPTTDGRNRSLHDLSVPVIPAGTDFYLAWNFYATNISSANMVAIGLDDLTLYGTGTIIASPEPSSLAALAAGGPILLRPRRRRETAAEASR